MPAEFRARVGVARSEDLTSKSLLGAVMLPLRPIHSHRPAKLLQSVRFAQPPKINLIPYNPVPSIPYESPESVNTNIFFSLLKKRGCTVHTRKPQGQDLSAACGQLALAD